MKYYLCCLLLITAISGCSKRTRPKQVERKITEGTWTIASISGNGIVVEGYAGYNFAFTESKTIKVTGLYASTGSWDVGLNKNPAVLYMSFPPGGGLEFLADDWQVVEMKKDRMRLQRNDESNSGTITFRK